MFVLLAFDVLITTGTSVLDHHRLKSGLTLRTGSVRPKPGLRLHQKAVAVAAEGGASRLTKPVGSTQLLATGPFSKSTRWTLQSQGEGFEEAETLKANHTQWKLL